MSQGRGGGRISRTIVGLLLAPACALGAVSIAVAETPAPPEKANLVGPFEFAGHITVAKRVLGERAGQNFFRTWTFYPSCPVGACDSVGVVRERAGGSDTVTLVQQAPGIYTGTGRFIAPLRCGRRTYARGQAVRFTLTVQVTAAAALRSGAIVATRVSAAYTNSMRTNLTRCFAVLGHDAATYQGQQVQVPGQS